ncbi:MAG: hypothetical protein R6U98_32570, partial [Pirellulaceae bacterium]
MLIFGLMLAVGLRACQAFAEHDGRRKTPCQATRRQGERTASERMDREGTGEAVRAMEITSSA